MRPVSVICYISAIFKITPAVDYAPETGDELG